MVQILGWTRWPVIFDHYFVKFVFWLSVCRQQRLTDRAREVSTFIHIHFNSTKRKICKINRAILNRLIRRVLPAILWSFDQMSDRWPDQAVQLDPRILTFKIVLFGNEKVEPKPRWRLLVDLGAKKLLETISKGFNELVIEDHVCDVRYHVKVFDRIRRQVAQLQMKTR